MPQANPIPILQRWFVSLVSGDDADLSARQSAVLLTAYSVDGPHTVRGLAARLNVSKPAITRALDRLGELDLIQRKIDPLDRRSVLVERTIAGKAHIRRLTTLWQQAERDAAAAATEKEAARG
jgi:DNA-binding MarR family transcriptional regulator